MNKKRMVSFRVLAVALALLLLSPLAPPVCAGAAVDPIPDRVGETVLPLPQEGETGSLDFIRASFGLAMAAKTDISSLSLVPGGMPFGIRMETQGVMVVGLSEVVCGGKTCRPAHEAGLRQKDIITAINGKAVSTAEEATALISASGGAPLSITARRGDEVKEYTVTPRKSDKDGRYQCGMWLRDSASGIGTVTFIDPENGLFGGLGHGVCDSDTGALVPLARGNVLSVKLNGAVKGECGKPGELRGSFTGQRLGSVVTNSECGVFGVLHKIPTGKYPAMPVAAANEVKAGEAKVLCTLDDGGIGEYTVEISNIDHSARPTKSFSVRVTDPTLLSKTGGIVQGMSGSPIIQGGKLIGAVTHVLVDDPTTGYGIFIENMLARMQMRAAA